MIDRKDDNWLTYSMPYGWYGSCNVFYNIGSIGDPTVMFNDIITWLENTIHNHKQNVHWLTLTSVIHLQFRKEDDMLMFKLRWPATNSSYIYLR